MEPMPLAGQFCASPEEAGQADVYPLTWVRCSTCTLVQVEEDISDAVLYGHYRYSSSTVPGLVRHFEHHAAYLAGMVTTNEPRVLEIGCNDGVLLRMLPKSWHLVGVDPSDVAATSATGGYELIPAPFTLPLAESLREAGPFDLVTSSNTLAHLSDLAGALEGVAHLLAADGLFVMEVHDLDATLDGGQWDTIYHEHKAEWSEGSLTACLIRAGLQPLAMERLPLHGGVLRVTCRPSPPAQGRGRSDDETEVTRLAKIRAAYESRRQTPLYRRLLKVVETGGALCAYGASGRANVWLNQLSELEVKFVVDDSPLRVGSWLPRVAIPVVGPARLYEAATGACIVTAWNHAPDIIGSHPDYRGEWLATFGAAA